MWKKMEKKLYNLYCYQIGFSLIKVDLSTLCCSDKMELFVYEKCKITFLKDNLIMTMGQFIY